MKGIPDNITYYCQNQPVKSVNEITGEDYGVVLPAWAKDSVGNNSTAISWAKGRYGRDNNNSIKPCRVVTVTNTDITDIIITDISYRGQGSKVYKALVHGLFLIDISAECLFEVLSCGTIVNGRIKSPMFFGTAKNKLSLILRDGKFHKDILFRNLPDIKQKELKKYHVYEKLNCKEIYLSNNNHIKLLRDSDNRYDRSVGEYIYSNKKVCVRKKEKKNISVTYNEKDEFVFIKNKKLEYNWIQGNKTFNFKLDILDVGESYFEKWIEEVEAFDFFSLDIFDNYSHVEQVYNMVSALEYKPKSESLKRLISWVDSLTENWSSNFKL